MIATVWIGVLLISATLAYERPTQQRYGNQRNGQDQGYGLPAQGYAIPPAAAAADYGVGFAPSAGYGAPQPSGYGSAPVASQGGYGAPSAYGSSYQVEMEYPEEESKWAKLPGMFQKAIKGSMDKNKERLESMKEKVKMAGQMKKEMSQQIKEQIKEHLKSKKPEPQYESYAPAYPAATGYSSAPAYSAPAYSAPVYQQAPTPVYSSQAYQAPAPSSYQAPTPSYSPPAPTGYSSGSSFGESSYAAGAGGFIPSDPLPVPFPVATPSSYRASPAVVLPPAPAASYSGSTQPINSVPTPIAGFASSSSYGN